MKHKRFLLFNSHASYEFPPLKGFPSDLCWAYARFDARKDLMWDKLVLPTMKTLLDYDYET